MHNQRVSLQMTKARKWVMEKGISDGERPTDLATREEVWLMLYRMKNNDAPVEETLFEAVEEEYSKGKWFA